MALSRPVLRSGLTRGLYVSHGTLEIRDFSASKRFFREVLGVEAYRHSPQSMFVRKGVYMTIACVQTDQVQVDQGWQNRWGLDVGSRQDVDRAYEKIMQAKDELGIQEVRPPRDVPPFYAFSLRDPDGNWWDVQFADPGAVDALFASSEETPSETHT